MKRHRISSDGTTRRRFPRVALIGALAVGLLTPAVASSGGVSAASTGSDIAYLNAGTTTIIRGIQVSGYEGKTVLASLSTSQGSLQLASTTGLTLSYGFTSFTGKSLNFTGSQDAVNAALKTLGLNLALNDVGRVALTTMFTESKDGLAYFPENQHFYKYVEYGKSYNASKNAASANQTASQSTEFGLKGYLANITSAAENDFVSSKIEGAQNVWIGGSDKDSENTWTYTDGPDKGTTFWTGCANDRTTTPGTSGTAFAKWAPSEPNNFNGILNAPDPCTDGKTSDVSYTQGEDCMVTNWDESVLAANPRPSTDKYGVGYWNDIPCDFVQGSYSYLRVQGLLIEYGNQPNSSTFPTGVDLRTQYFTVIEPKYIPLRVPAPVTVTKKKKVSPISALKNIFAKKKPAPSKPAVTTLCPKVGEQHKVSFTLNLQEVGRYSLQIVEKGTRRAAWMQCGTTWFGLTSLDRFIGTSFNLSPSMKPPRKVTFTAYVLKDEVKVPEVSIDFLPYYGNGQDSRRLTTGVVSNLKVARG